MRYLDSKNFKRIIQEAISKSLNEATPVKLGGTKPSVFGGAKPSINPQQVANQQTAARKPGMDYGKKPIDQYAPKVIYSYYEADWQNKTATQTNADVDEVLKIGIEYIWSQHQEYLKELWEQKYSDIFSSNFYRNPGADKNDSKIFEIVIKPGKEDDFKKIVPDLVKDIESLNKIMPKSHTKQGNRYWKTETQNPALKYWMPWFPEFAQILIDSVDKSPNKNDINDVNDRMANTWMELLSKLNDPETLQKMQNIGGIVLNQNQNQKPPKIAAKDANNASTFGLGGFSSGHQLSPQNQVEIFTQDPNATFVTQEWVWRDTFNRTIIDQNKKIIILKADSRKPSDPVAFEKACTKCGYASAQQFKTLKHQKQLSGSQIWAVQAMYSLMNTADTFFHPVIVFDVSNTQVIPGMKDVFNDEPGLINNLKGIPNAAAQAANYTPIQAQTGTQGQGNGRSDMSDEQLNAIKETIKAIISASGGTLPGGLGQNIGDDIAKLGYAYGAMLLDTNKVGVNLSKNEMIEAFKMCFSASVAATYGFPTSEGARYLNSVLANRGTDTDAKSMILLFLSKYKELIKLININLIRMSRKNRKSKTTQPQLSKVVEEDSIDGVVNSYNDVKPVPPLSTDQLLSVIGLDRTFFEDDTENDYVEQDDTISNSMLQESFFKFLDKMDRL